MKKDVGIPTEVTNDILWRLPVGECMARFCCVSKSWRDLLSDPAYIRQKLSGCGGGDSSSSSSTSYQTMIITKSGSLLFSRSSSSVSVLHSPPADTFEPLLPGNNNRGSYVEVEAYCNGLFCLSEKGNGKDLFLWNRATSEIKVVPRPPEFYHSSAAVPWPGFGSLTDTVRRARVVSRIGPWLGFDSESDDYKILWQTRIVLTQTDQTRHLVEVYSLRNDSWKKLDEDDVDGGGQPLLPSLILGPTNSQLRKGKLYWSHLSNKEAPVRTLLFDSFDMSREVFERVELSYPAASANDLYGTPTCLLNEEFMVALFEVHDDTNVHRDPDNSGISIHDDDVSVKRDASWEIWVLLKYWVPESWTKLFVVTTPRVSFIGFSRNLECFFMKYGGSYVKDNTCVVFDPQTRKLRYLKIEGNEVINYIPSQTPLRNYNKKGTIEEKKF